jgi:hypothetical protein
MLILKGFHFLRLMSNKITLGSYGYFIEFAFFFFLENNDFFDYVKKLLNFARKASWILGDKQQWHNPSKSV